MTTPNFKAPSKKNVRPVLAAHQEDKYVVGRVKGLPVSMEDRAYATRVVAMTSRGLSSPICCAMLDDRIWKNGCIEQLTVTIGGGGTKRKRPAYHDFDHHASIGAGKPTSAERVD